MLALTFTWNVVMSNEKNTFSEIIHNVNMCITQLLAARWRQMDFQNHLQHGNEPLLQIKARGMDTAAKTVGQMEQ